MTHQPTPIEHAILHYLSDGGDGLCQSRELVGIINHPHTDIWTALRNLIETLGWVTYETGPGRRQCLALTALGWQICRTLKLI